MRIMRAGCVPSALMCTRVYSAQKKKGNSPEDAKYFSSVKGVTFFLAPLYEAELRYQHSFGKKNCLTIIGGGKLFASAGLLTFFFFTTVYHAPNHALHCTGNAPQFNRSWNNNYWLEPY